MPVCAGWIACSLMKSRRLWVSTIRPAWVAKCNTVVGNRLICLTGFDGGQNIVAPRAQRLDCSQREILVRVKSCHQPASFSRMARAISSAWTRSYPQALARSCAFKVGYALRTSASDAPCRRRLASVQTGMRVRAMQASPPQTSDRDSMPGQDPPMSCRAQAATCAFSARLICARSFSAD